MKETKVQECLYNILTFIAKKKRTYIHQYVYMCICVYIFVKVCISMTISMPIYIQKIFLERLDSQMGNSRDCSLGSGNGEKHSFQFTLLQ